MGGMDEAQKEKQLKDAMLIAIDTHREQFRDPPDGRPYLCHVLDVMNMMPANDHLARLVAILHDTVEDAAEKEDSDTIKEAKREAVRQRIKDAKFDDAVLLAVQAISHIKKHGLPSLGKTEEYLLYVNESILPNRLATQVKIADNYVNMKDLIAAAASDDEALGRLHKYASSVALLTAKKGN
jgi:(p)ppGpp synthase/HD superfamily hydrolase